MIQTLLFIIAFLAVVIVLMNLFQQSIKPSNPIRTLPINRGNWWNGWNRWWDVPPRTGGPSRPSPERPTIPNRPLPPDQCNSNSDCRTGQVCRLNRGGFRSCEKGGEMNAM
jgi:hypothetical protein